MALISAGSILCMAVSALVSIVVPVALLIIFRKKYGAKIVPALVGAAAFVVFAMVMEQAMHMLVLKPGEDGSKWLSAYTLGYMVYGSLAAGVFEETGRFLSFKLLRKRYGGIRTALSYGVGHGGIEAILVGGTSMISTIAISVMANAGSAALTEGPNAELAARQLQAIAGTPPAMFLIAGAERLFALTIHIALSVIVFYSVYGERKIWLYPAAILLHALIDAPVALSQVGVLTNVLALEGLVLFCAVVLALLAVYTHHKLKSADDSVIGEGDAYGKV